MAPRAALACPVCFGQSDSPLAKAMNLGILAMLVVVAGVLASFASFFIYLSRRARLADQSATGDASTFDASRAPPRRRGPLNAELSGDAGSGIDPRR